MLDDAPIVATCAGPDTPEVESQDHAPRVTQRLGYTVNGRGVHGAPIDRVRVTHDSSTPRKDRRLPYESLQMAV